MNLEKITTDARQSSQWGSFMSFHGWETYKVGSTYIFSRMLPGIARSILKIQHPKGPLDFQAIEQLVQKKRALFTVIEPHTDGYAPQDFLLHGYHISKLRFAHSATILIDLSLTQEALLKSFSENARRNINKAAKQVTVTEVSLGNASDAVYETTVMRFYRLYQATGKQKHFYVPSLAETKAKIAAFRDSSSMLFAYEKGKEDDAPIAVLWVAAVGKTLIYCHPGNTQRGYQLLANYLLVWEAMLLGKKKKLAVLDFETAYDKRYPGENKLWRGYTEFKLKFGGTMVYYPPSYIKFYNRPAKLLYQLGTLFSQ